VLGADEVSGQSWQLFNCYLWWRWSDLTLCEQLSWGCDCTHFHITLKFFLWRFLFISIDLCVCICMSESTLQWPLLCSHIVGFSWMVRIWAQLCQN
jgi:hypothetical protein